jgi:hypothetical protein
MQKQKAAVDTFAAIATELVSDRHAGLEAPSPAHKSSTHLPLQHGLLETPRPIAKKISTPEQLCSELAALRERMAPFLANLAPELSCHRPILEVLDFQWRIETPQDRAEFASVQNGSGEWQRVSIPHYGPPLGPASTLYRQEMDLPEEMFSRERQVLCFDAVDYRCQVYLNGTCLGTHEGFFEAFEFDVTGIARCSRNILLVRVENDFTMLGQAFSDGDTDGDKIYAATGLG